MTTKARLAYGSVFEWGTDGVAYTPIPEATALVVPSFEPEYIDVTNSDSPNRLREFIQGLVDPGDIEISANYTSDLFEIAFGYQTNGTLVHFRTTLTAEDGQSTGDVFTFTGFVTPKVDTNAITEAATMNLKVRLSGNVAFTKGAAA